MQSEYRDMQAFFNDAFKEMTGQRRPSIPHPVSPPVHNIGVGDRVKTLRDKPFVPKGAIGDAVQVFTHEIVLGFFVNGRPAERTYRRDEVELFEKKK